MSRKNRPIAYVPQSPYGKSLNTAQKVDKSSIVWRDFLNGVKRRKRLLNHIRNVGLDENDMTITLKRLLLEIRQLTLKVIEDALEIEYRSQFGDTKAPIRAGVAMQLPPITSFRGLEGKEDLYMLSDIISDTDDLYLLPNIQAILPLDFPSKRNPFILGQDVDGLANLEGPKPEPGNSAMELKALEFLRFKRAAKALLRAEVQIMNKMPLMLEDIEHIWKFITTDKNVSILIRTVITLLHPDNIRGTERSPELRYLIDEAIYMDPAEFLRQLNNFKHEDASYHIELLAAIRHVLKECSTVGFTDIATSFLSEWVRLILGSDCFMAESVHIVQEEIAGTPISKSEKSKKKESSVEIVEKIKNEDLQKSNKEDDSSKKSKSSTIQQDLSDDSLKKLMSKTGPKKPRRPKNEDHQMNGISLDTMNTLKYEVIKMQQELLKRKILDPKAYGLVPTKALGLENSTLVKNKGPESKLETVTIEEPNELTPFVGVMDSFNALLLLKELMLLKFSSDGYVEILVNTNKTILYTQYKRTILVTENSQLIEKTQLIVFNPLNKLIFDRLTGYQIDSLFEMTEKIRKNNLAPFLSLVHSHLERYAIPDQLYQQINFIVDSCIVRDVLITGNISVNVEIERSENSNGLIIRATPQPGSLLTSNKMELNPITLFIHDNELLVLLINQRGLYTLALNKWSCLEMVARWLLSRIHINRIPIPFYNTSSINYDDTGRQLLITDSDSKNGKPTTTTATNTVVHDNTLTTSTSSNNIKTYFEVNIDRTIDIDNEIKQYWFAHNLPVLNGVTIKYDITARQEMEMLYINITLTLKFLHPTIIMKRKKEKEDAKLKLSSLYQFTSPYDDESALVAAGGGDQVIPNTWDIPFDHDPEVETHVLHFSYGLTGIELLIFGTIDSTTTGGTGTSTYDAATSTSSSKYKNQFSYHSNQFMKNIMSRLHLTYLGNKLQPFDNNKLCLHEDNWEISYNRKLIKNVRTISGGTMIVTASCIGNEILYEVKPTDTVLYGNDIGSKLFSLSEINEIIQSEGWSSDLLDPCNRMTLTYKIMEKLKIILDYDKHRIEFYTYPETRLLEIIIQATINKSEQSIGLIEINNLLTLSDLRIIINHELDRDLIPKLYRFIYKSSTCALKQEPFRKAWECLPKCYLISKTIKEINRSHDTTSTIDKSQELLDKTLLKAKKMEDDANKKNKLAKKLIPIPIPTLCMAQEGVWEIYTRHDMSSILQPGDILRIGHIDSTDFIIPMSFQRILDKNIVSLENSENGAANTPTTPPTEVFHHQPIKAIPIDQYFLTFGESNLFIYGNTPFSSLPPPPVIETEPEIYLDENGKAVIVENKPIDPESLIPSEFHYITNLELNQHEGEGVDGGDGKNSKDQQDTTTSTDKNNKENNKKSTSIPLMRQDAPGSLQPIKSINPSSTSSSSSIKAVTTDIVNKIIHPTNTDSPDQSSSSSSTTVGGSRKPGKIYRDMWLWKCIPRAEDHRPKWRQMYDNGEVKYPYIYQEISNKDPYIFHVKVPLKLIEQYCCDYRCEDMTIYHQRVHEMSRIPLDLYTDLTYTYLVNDVLPASITQGIDEVKFIEFIKSLGIFPDLHKPARISQLTLAFFREVNGPHGDETYVNYYGFCALLQEISLIRFPFGLFDLDECEKFGEFIRGDGPPQPPTLQPATNPPSLPNANSSTATATATATTSLSPIPATIPSLLPMELDITPLSTERQQPSLPPPLGVIDGSKWQSQNTRRSSIAMVTIKKPKGKKKVIQSKKNKLEGLDSPLVTQVDSRHASMAYRKFIVDYLITIPCVSDAIWAQAKDLTMEKEILRYAAITRIIACWRCFSQLSKYQQYRHAIIILQSYIRMKQSQKKIKKLFLIYYEDWLYRLRYHCSILIQSIIRRYNSRCWYIHTINKIREREIIVTKARRQRLSKLRQKEKKTIVFKQIRRINGIMVLLILRRKDQRNYSNDYGMRLEVYNPKYQLINIFIIEENDLRRYMQDILLINSLSIGDLLNKNNLEKVISVRLLCRLSKRVGDPPKFILSRQALGQKGPKILTRGRNINGELFVCTLYETGYDIVIQCYHQHTSIIFPCTILKSTIITWITEIYYTTCSNDIEKQLQPPLLRNENKLKLFYWLINQIIVDKRYGKFQVMFSIQYKKSLKMESILKIQSIIRRSIIRSKIPYLLDQYILKIQTSIYDPTPYYLNILTGESSWNKPSLLKSHQDIPTQPYYRWVYLPYSSHINNQQPLYVNPLTGKYTHLTPDQAAKKIQSMIRNWMLRLFYLTKEEIKKGRIYEIESQLNYEREPTRLAFILNYALVTFCIFLNYSNTKKLILEALSLADSNPTTTRLYAIYLLSTCESPLNITREHANTLLRDAWRRDPNSLKFKIALNYFFKYSCYRQPRNSKILLNLGLVEYYIFQNNKNAEKCFRRALAISPFDECIMENWKQLRDIFPDSKLVYRPRGRMDKMNADTLGGGKKTTIHGKPVIENLAWAGWVFVESDPMFKDGEGEYWYNPATGQSQKHMPEDWQKEWELRAWRSIYEGEKDGLEHYFDPVTATYFQRHVLTNTYQ